MQKPPNNSIELGLIASVPCVTLLQSGNFPEDQSGYSTISCGEKDFRAPFSHPHVAMMLNDLVDAIIAAMNRHAARLQLLAKTKRPGMPEIFREERPSRRSESRLLRGLHVMTP